METKDEALPAALVKRSLKARSVKIKAPMRREIRTRDPKNDGTMISMRNPWGLGPTDHG